MKNYCLTLDEINEILQWKSRGKSLINHDLSLIIDEAKVWDTRILHLNILFARLLDRNDVSVIDEKYNNIEIIYKLSNQDEFYFEIEELSEKFIEYMLRHPRNKDNILEDALVELLHNFISRDYEKALRC